MASGGTAWQPPGTVARIARVWRPGDQLDVRFEAPIRLVVHPETALRVGGIAVQRGPLLYALPIAEDWQPYEAVHALGTRRSAQLPGPPKAKFALAGGVGTGSGRSRFVVHPSSISRCPTTPVPGTSTTRRSVCGPGCERSATGGPRATATIPIPPDFPTSPWTSPSAPLPPRCSPTAAPACGWPTYPGSGADEANKPGWQTDGCAHRDPLVVFFS